MEGQWYSDTFPFSIPCLNMLYVKMPGKVGDFQGDQIVPNFTI
jgi:hypothetical protein